MLPTIRENNWPNLWMNELFHNLVAPSSGGSSRWTPPVNVREDAESYAITAELPGLETKDVEITLQGDTLTLKGSKVHEAKRENEQVHVYERTSGSFSRTFTFPAAVDPDGVRAEMKNGVLAVRVKKSGHSLPRRIDVQAS